MRGIIIVVTTILAVTLTCCAKYAVTQDEFDDPVEKLTSEKREHREQGKKEILEKRKETIEKLLSLVEDTWLKKENRAAVVTAIEVLGELRAEEAVPTLSKMLLYGVKGDIHDVTEDPRSNPYTGTRPVVKDSTADLLLRHGYHL